MIRNNIRRTGHCIQGCTGSKKCLITHLLFTVSWAMNIICGITVNIHLERIYMVYRLWRVGIYQHQSKKNIRAWNLCWMMLSMHIYVTMNCLHGFGLPEKRCMTISRYHARSCFYPMWLIAGSISDGRHAIVIPNHIPGCVFIIDELTNPSLETLLMFNY